MHVRSVLSVCSQGLPFDRCTLTGIRTSMSARCCGTMAWSPSSASKGAASLRLMSTGLLLNHDHQKVFRHGSQFLTAKRAVAHGRPSFIVKSAMTWQLEIKVHADYTTENIGTPSLELTFVAPSSGAQAGVVNTADCRSTPWELLYKVGAGEGSTRYGAVLSKEFQLPDSFGMPGALLVTKEPTNFKIDRVYLDTVSAWPKGSDDDKIPFLTNSWVADGYGGRIFFSGAPKLPDQTPDGLKELRQQELDNLRGPPNDTSERTGYERIYAYDLYNDLPGPDAATVSADRRPILGGTGPDKLPYPRRLRTGRPLNDLGDEPLPKGTKPWLPLDERFFASKEEEFDGGTTYAVAEAAGAAVDILFAGEPDIAKFASMAAVETLYTRTVPPSRRVVKAQIDTTLKPFSFNVNELTEAFNSFPEELRQRILDALKASQRPGNPLDFIAVKLFGVGLNDKIMDFMEGLMATWPLPTVRDKRYFTWHTDEEMGRQAVAGLNPFTIQLAPLHLFKGVSTITAKHLNGLLGGLPLEKAVAQKRLFWQDYHTVLAEDIAPRVTDGYQYAGRGIFFKDPATEALSIVAIELQAPKGDVRVFTRLSDREEVWQVAKAVFSSLDFAVHELASHFGETHAVMEPFAIATRRQLSSMHPVYQLMMPHYHYTFQINAEARSGLINGGGLVEKVFTTGPLSMEFSSRLYGKDWTFEQQGLPKDLESRGLAVLDNNGKVKQPLLLEDFPFAEDGLLVWDALVDYFTGYLNLYYSDSGAGGKPKVVEDVELVAWWKEARELGHPDKKEGWIELTDIPSLVQILATIAWTGSAHHAAVNFGQYAYAGYMPNKPSYIAKAIPAQGSAKEKALLEDFEFEYLDTLSDPIRTLATMLLVKLLSTHAQDEFYLSGPQTDWISDPKAVVIKKKFEDALVAAEAEMVARNERVASRARHAPAGVAYTLMFPSTTSNPVTVDNRGLTGMGIPYSVSI